MKKYYSILKSFFILITAFVLSACVHDDKYDTPNLDGVQCGELTANITMAEVKNLPSNTIITEDLVVEGYVSSSDETGNIYKYIYLQDNPVDPTQGLVLSVNQVNNYTRYPQGAKVYVKLKGLAMTVYGGQKQVGAYDEVTKTYGRVPEYRVNEHILRSCSEKEIIVPKVMKLSEMVTANDALIGALIQVNDAEFTSSVLCSTYAPQGETVDRPIADPSTATTRIVRNSGYASFTNKLLPSGKGKFVGIYSKYNSTYQMYIVRDTDLDMNQFPRKDGIEKDPCGFNPADYTQKTIAEVKALNTSGAYTKITGDFYVKATVTANDETGNLYKYLYIEDETGGLRVNLNKTDLYLENKYKVGRKLIIKLKDLLIGKVNGEYQLGALYNNAIGQVETAEIYKHFFDSGETGSVTPTVKTINDLKVEDVGRWIKIKGLQFVESDLGEAYAVGTTTNRTLKDCEGNTIILRTSNYATFAAYEVDPGKGDVTAILSYFNGVYQLWIPYLKNADLDDPRCDDAVAPKILFSDEFGSTLNAANWTAVSVVGPQVWSTSNQGNASNYYAVMNGYSGGNIANEDYLISKEIDLGNYNDIYMNFDSDVNYNGQPLKLLVTDNYSGNPTTTSWTEVSADFDTAQGWGFKPSGNVSLNAFKGKKIRFAFKYVSTTAAANTWEIDNVKVKAK